MNSSGRAVRDFYEKYEVSADKMLIVYDDVNIDYGTLRVRPSGSDGGQNGIKSVIYEMQTEEIPRLRVGIKNEAEFEKIRTDEDKGLADFVLSGFAENEYEVLDKVIESAKDAVVSFIDDGIKETMNKFNRDFLNNENN